MKKNNLLSIGLLVSLVAGCSCSKIDEKTYESAVETYRNTDAISFTRIEKITKKDEQIYTRKKIEATYVYGANKNVSKMSYGLVVTENNNVGGSTDTKVANYYYSGERNTLYAYSRNGKDEENRDKYSDTGYSSMFNVDVCQDLDCTLMIIGNIAPVYRLDEVSNFSIDEQDNGAVATYTAICPSYENCASSSQEIDYKVRLNSDGNIEYISYSIVNGDYTHEIKYAFVGYGSNNISVNFPDDLVTYTEKQRN